MDLLIKITHDLRKCRDSWTSHKTNYINPSIAAISKLISLDRGNILYHHHNYPHLSFLNTLQPNIRYYLQWSYIWRRLHLWPLRCKSQLAEKPKFRKYKNSQLQDFVDLVCPNNHNQWDQLRTPCVIWLEQEGFFSSDHCKIIKRT